jgi:hypothetical protein
MLRLIECLGVTLAARGYFRSTLNSGPQRDARASPFRANGRHRTLGLI